MNVYDFDNTVYDGESSFDFFVYCMIRHPGIIKFLPKAVFVLIKYKRCRITKEQLFAEIEKYDREFVRLAGDITGLVKGFWDKHEKKIKPFYLRQKRSDDVIISASFGFMLEEIMNRLGVRYICSDMDIESGRLIRLCFGDNKVKLFESEFPGAVIDNFYTDSMHDLPMIEIADRAYIVKGNRIKRVKGSDIGKN